MAYTYIGRSLVGLKEVNDKDEAIYIAFEIDDEPAIWRAMQNDAERSQGIAQQERERAQKAAAAELTAAQDAAKKAAQERDAATKQRDMYEAQYDELLKKVADLEEKAANAARADALATDYENLNANLLRIMRERSNSERKLEQKKAHPGYIVQSIQMCSEHYYSGGKHRTARTWRTVIETPYDFATGAGIIPLILQDLSAFQQLGPDNAGPAIFSKLKVKCKSLEQDNIQRSKKKDGDYVPPIIDDLKDDFENLDTYMRYSKDNHVYRVALGADRRAGRWQVTIWTTKPVDPCALDLDESEVEDDG